MKKILLSILFLITLNADQYTKGEILYFQKGCNGCHGLGGSGMNNYPKLAHRSEAYLLKKLDAYAKGTIKTMQASLMRSFALSLTKEESKDLVYYLANVKEEEEQERYAPAYETWGDGGS
jgi:cytochrome c553